MAEPPVLSPLNRLYRTATTLAIPMMWLSAWRVGRSRDTPSSALAEKMGRATAPRPPGPLIWLHGTGLGELFMAKPIVERIVAQWPAFNLLVTPKNLHYQAQFARMFPDGTAFQCAPFDAPAVLRRFCDHWRPDFVLWVRKNPTPNVMTELQRTASGCAILQAELGDRAYSRERRLLPLFRETYGRVDLVAVRSNDDAARYLALGAPNVLTLGDLRNCGAPLAADPVELARLRAAVGERPCWVAASTRDDEYMLAGRVHLELAARHPRLLTIIAPRHPAFGASNAAALRAAGLRVALRTAGEALAPDTDIYVADTLGELGLWYRLCPIAFVGGSFAPKGGHNVIEPARLGAAVLCGPDMRNIATIAAEMVAAGALTQVQTEAGLGAAVGRLLDSPEGLARARNTASAFAEHSAMASERVFEALRPHLARAAAGAARAAPPTPTLPLKGGGSKK